MENHSGKVQPAANAKSTKIDIRPFIQPRRRYVTCFSKSTFSFHLHLFAIDRVCKLIAVVISCQHVDIVLQLSTTTSPLVIQSAPHLEATMLLRVYCNLSLWIMEN
ncbi:hypothetical protein BCIN_16g02600 [Botrytis cinerea B05.10]|uniref:Uncharacterized protein n=1 Tax=Botryotinia fuckeliana (strain B05.10) TaxID=332648 RepID=A0A384K6U2_BOTFB|nr:hypothetical protein BCIN_16g02600 [Botrytis cinerea B05.10]ATZ58492.1 hypothetical protein BCIN_16g02600 [Botrytis cinerea B05.10]